MKLRKLLLTMTLLASTACGGVLNIDVENSVRGTMTAIASQATNVVQPTPTPSGTGVQPWHRPPGQVLNAPTKTAIPVAEATPSDTAAPETPGWTQYRSEAFRVTFAYPASWTIRVADNFIILGSPDRAGFETDSELAYYVFIGEDANLGRRPFPDEVTEGLGEELRQAFQFTTVSIGDYVTYQTESLPSQAGALQVFFEDGDRYVMFGLAPYDSQNPFPGQDRHAELFEALLQTVRLNK